MWFSKEERELRRLQKESERDEREIEKMLKELKRYADHFKKYLEYMDSLKKAETFRLPDDYPLPYEILPQHFPDMTGRCCFKGGWGYDAEHAAVLKSDPKIGSEEKSDTASLESAFIEKRSREELFFARSEDQRFAEPGFKIVERTRREVNGVPYDHILADVSGHFINYWNELKAEWEEHDGYKDDPAGLANYLKRKESWKITYRTEFWFNIADFC